VLDGGGLVLSPCQLQYFVESVILPHQLWFISITHLTLEPGGVVFLDELDPIIFTYQQYLQRRGDEDIIDYMTGPTWMHKANSLYTGFALKNNFIVGFVPFRYRRFLTYSLLAQSHLPSPLHVREIGFHC
jgi:hypothetical protein